MSLSTSGRRAREPHNRNSDLENTTSMTSQAQCWLGMSITANGTLIIAADASFMPERRAEAAEPAIQADEAEFDAQNDSVANIISPEARRLNDGRDTMEVEVGGKTVRKAATKEKAGRAKEKPFKDKVKKEEHLREEAGREKAQKERKAAEKAEQEILKRAERAEQARKGNEARKTAAVRRRNFGGA